MKFVINKKVFADALSRIVRAVAVKEEDDNTVQNINIDAQEEKIEFSAFNGTEFQMRTTVSNADFFKMEETGTHAVPGKQLHALISSYPDGDILVEFEKNKDADDDALGKMQFYVGGKKTKNKRHSLVATSAEWDLDYEVEGHEMSMAPDKFDDIVGKTNFAASSEKYRGSLQGILWDIGKEETHIVATDGRRMSHLILDDVSAKKAVRASIPAYDLRELSRTFSKSLSDIKITVNNSKMKLEQECLYGSVEAVVHGFEDTYPEYQKVVDAKRDAIEFTLDTSMLNPILSRIVSISPTEADFFIGEDKIRITSDASVGDYEEDLAITDFSGEEAVVRMTLGYVKEMISVAESQIVKVRIGSLDRPIEFAIDSSCSFMIQPLERKEVDTLPD